MNHPAMIVADLLLLLGLTLRLTRLVVADDLGAWYLRGPVEIWASLYDYPGDLGWRTKIAQGLSCPFCVGFWIGAACALSLLLVGGPGDAPDWWRWIAGIFALNWVAAHLGSRAGDTAD